MATTRCTPRQDETVAVPVLAATTSSTPRRLRTRRLHAKSSDACKKWGDETPHLRTDSARVRSTPRALHRRSQNLAKNGTPTTPCTTTPCGVQQHRRLRDDSARDDSMRSHQMPVKNGAMRHPISARTPPESARLRENSTSDHKNLAKTVQRRLRARRLRAESSETHKNGSGRRPSPHGLRSTPRELRRRSQKPRKNAHRQGMVACGVGRSPPANVPAVCKSQGFLQNIPF